MAMTPDDVDPLLAGEGEVGDREDRELDAARAQQPEPPDCGGRRTRSCTPSPPS
jgi:hypothetical protein